MYVKRIHHEQVLNMMKEKKLWTKRNVIKSEHFKMESISMELFVEIQYATRAVDGDWGKVTCGISN